MLDRDSFTLYHLQEPRMPQETNITLWEPGSEGRPWGWGLSGWSWPMVRSQTWPSFENSGPTGKAGTRMPWRFTPHSDYGAFFWKA